MQTLVLTNRKGGVGKTTLAIHAAWYFGESRRVLFLELDPQRNGSGTLRDTTSTVQLSHLLGGRAVVGALQEPGLVTIAADDGVNALAAQPLAAQQDALRRLDDNLKSIRDGFDICVIDTSPATSHLNLGALMLATHVIAPIHVTQYSTDGIKTLLQQILGVKKRFNARLDFLGLLPNCFMPAQPSQKRNLQALLATFGDQYMFCGLLGARQAYADASASRMPAWKQEGTAAREAGREIRGVLARIDQRMHGGPEERSIEASGE